LTTRLLGRLSTDVLNLPPEVSVPAFIKKTLETVFVGLEALRTGAKDEDICFSDEAANTKCWISWG
jgi:hypothetical protein